MLHMHSPLSASPMSEWYTVVLLEKLDMTPDMAAAPRSSADCHLGLCTGSQLG